MSIFATSARRCASCSLLFGFLTTLMNAYAAKTVNPSNGSTQRWTIVCAWKPRARRHAENENSPMKSKLKLANGSVNATNEPGNGTPPMTLGRELMICKNETKTVWKGGVRERRDK